MRVSITADDGHTFTAYRAEPPRNRCAPWGAVVVVQEVFGVNPHIREVCAGFAEDGLLAVAPPLFDRIERGIELAYTENDLARGRELRQALGWDPPLRDIAAAARALSAAGKVGVVGYCWGGSLAWLAACRLPAIACAVAYYGGQIAQFVDERPQAPVLLHFGERDAYIPAADVLRIQTAHPAVPVHLYPAGHGFNCDRRADYHEESARIARARTLDFLRRHLAEYARP